MRRKLLKAGWLIPIVVVLVGFGLYHQDPISLQVLRHNMFDQYQRWDARPYQDAPVRVVDLDDESLSRIGQWPWPRTRLVALVEQLRAQGASVIVFDVIFAEKDRTSPANMAQTWSDAPASLRNQLTALPDHDTLFARSLAKGSVVLGNMPEVENEPRPELIQHFEVVDLGPPSSQFLHNFSGSVGALANFQQAAAGNGAIAFVADADGIVRRVPLLVRINKQTAPSLSAEALRIKQHASDYVVTVSEEAGAGIEEVLIGDISIPTTKEGEIWVRFTHGGDARYIPAWKVLAGKVPASEIKDRIVLIGTSAKGLMDLRFSPLRQVVPGVEVHALVLEQIMTGKQLTRPNWSVGLEVPLSLVAGLVVGFLALYSGALVSAALAGVILVATGWGGWIAYSKYSLLLDPSFPALIMVTSFALGSLYHHIMSERRQRWVKQAFARYVSPNLVAHLVENPDELELGGYRRECSFIFTDLAGFTSLMEKLDPAEAVGLLNTYLDNMIRIAFENEGTLDRIVGDAVAIMFSAPVEQLDHRQRALRCAEAMHHFSIQYALDAQARGVPWGVTRIGIHTGEVTVGNFGGSTIFDYRALGDPVNTASRLESVNKQLGTLVCVSEATLFGCAGVEVRPVGRLVLKGKTEPLMVYQPRFSSQIELPSPDEDYAHAFAQMAQHHPDALATFTKLARLRQADPLVQFHLNRLNSGQVGDVIVFTSK